MAHVLFHSAIYLKELKYEGKINIDDKALHKLASLFESQLFNQSPSLAVHSCTDTLHSRVRTIAMKLCKSIVQRRSCNSDTQLDKVARWHNLLKKKVGTELFEEIQSIMIQLRTARLNAYALHINNYDKKRFVGQCKDQKVLVNANRCCGHLAGGKSMVNEVRDIFFNTHIFCVYNSSSNSCGVREWHELVNIAKRNLEQYHIFERQFSIKEHSKSI